MIRKYRGYQLGGKREQHLLRVSALVKQHGVRDRVPRVCTELGSGRGFGPFYLFIAYEAHDDGSVDEDVEAFLRDVSPAVAGDFSRDEIKSMVTHDITIQEFARRLRYQPVVVPDAADPFADEEEDESDDALAEIGQTQRLDRLLLWMSAHADGSFGTLDSARRTLDIKIDTRRVLRNLRLLGHCETNAAGSAWSIAPSVLIRTEDDAFVLAGGRDERLLTELRERFEPEESLQPSGAGPSVFRIRAAGLPELVELSLLVAEHADRALAGVVPPIAGWAENLVQVPVETARFTIERWDGAEFSPAVFSGQPGFFKLSGADSTAPTFNVYYSPELGFRRGEWYGLRFLAQHGESKRVPCCFDAGANRLKVPMAWRWPEIYERVLVLSSGSLAQRQGDWLVYESVEPELLERLVPLLDLDVDHV